MKVYSGKQSRARKGAEQGFTLIEMIGVLAVIAILAAVLIPKVFEAINNARVSNAAMTVNSIKTGCIDHYAKYGTFPVNGSFAQGAAGYTLTPPVAFDPVLLQEQLIDKPFQVKIGDGTAEAAGPPPTGTRVELVAAPTAAQLAAGTAVTGNGTLYNLAGGTGVDDISGTWIVQAVITGVAHADAIALNNAIDGTSPTMAEGAATGTDLQGRVQYGAAVNGTYTVYVYLTHR
jgi:prepilin-type N-terminal cleavage/methylation domain-containing protein